MIPKVLQIWRQQSTAASSKHGKDYQIEELQRSLVAALSEGDALMVTS